jgi:hypothetical protein
VEPDGRRREPRQKWLKKNLFQQMFCGVRKKKNNPGKGDSMYESDRFCLDWKREREREWKRKKKTREKRVMIKHTPAVKKDTFMTTALLCSSISGTRL